MSVNKKATIAVSSIESFKPPLLKVGVCKEFHVRPNDSARHTSPLSILNSLLQIKG